MNAYTPPIRTPQIDRWADCDALDDAAEEAWQALREECEAEFEDWQRADYDKREDADFSNWMVSKARWNRPNKYECALTYQERKLLRKSS